MKLHILDSRNLLANYIAEIETIYQVTSDKIGEILDVEGIDITLVDNKSFVPPGRIVGGHTYGPFRIEISVDCSQPEFKDLLQKQLPSIIAHETHHAVRMGKVGYGRTLGEALVTEGLAIHFALSVCPDDIPPWIGVLSEKRYNELLPRVKDEIELTDYNHRAWFFGSREIGIPHWAGYTIGYRLVGDYLAKHSGFSAVSLVGIHANDLLKEVV